MEIDFDALDQVISQKRVSPRASSPASLKTPKYIDVIQAGAVKRPTITRKSSTMRRVRKVAVKKVEKVAAPPVQSLSDLIDRELETGDTALGEDMPTELNVDDLVAYAESAELEAETATTNVTPEEAAKDFLGATQELAPFLPNVKVEKAPLSGDLPTHVTERANKSDRELASLDLKDDLTADKSALKEFEPPKARILTEERIAPKRPFRRPKRQRHTEDTSSSSRRPSPKKSSTPLVILLGILIAVFGAVAGAFLYLLTND
jgi:hypothetical protein